MAPEVEGREVREAGRSPAGLRVPADVVSALRRELVDLSHRAYQRGLIAGVSGNASIRLPEPDTDVALIKATGRSLGDMTVEDTLLITLDGEPMEDRTPSKEWRFHTGLYRLNPDFRAVFHLHPPYCVAWAVANQIPPLVHTAARGALGRLDIVDLAPAGSPELADMIVGAFKADPDLRVVLMREHGMVAAASDLHRAFYLADYIEDTAKVALLSTQVLQAVGMREQMADVAPTAWGDPTG